MSTGGGGEGAGYGMGASIFQAPGAWEGLDRRGKGKGHSHSGRAHSSKPQGGEHTTPWVRAPQPAWAGHSTRALDGWPLGSGMATLSEISGKANQQQNGGQGVRDHSDTPDHSPFSSPNVVKTCDGARPRPTERGTQASKRKPTNSLHPRITLAAGTAAKEKPWSPFKRQTTATCERGPSCPTCSFPKRARSERERSSLGSLLRPKPQALGLGTTGVTGVEDKW